MGELGLCYMYYNAYSSARAMQISSVRILHVCACIYIDHAQSGMVIKSNKR